MNEHKLSNCFFLCGLLTRYTAEIEGSIPGSTNELLGFIICKSLVGVESRFVPGLCLTFGDYKRDVMLCYRVDEELKQQILSMKLNGVSVTDIANQFRVPVSI